MSTVTIATPNAPHPKARVNSVDFASGVITFTWLDENEQPVDSGNSIAQFSPGSGWPYSTTIRAAIEGSTS